MKTIQTLAAELKLLCENQQFVEAYQTLFHNDAYSIDPMAPETGRRDGLDVLIAAEQAFLERSTVHRFEVSEPLISGKYFTCSFLMDATVEGRHLNIHEIGVYEVRDGKIAGQQFFIGEIKPVG